MKLTETYSTTVTPGQSYNFRDISKIPKSKGN